MSPFQNMREWEMVTYRRNEGWGIIKGEWGIAKRDCEE